MAVLALVLQEADANRTKCANILLRDTPRRENWKGAEGASRHNAGLTPREGEKEGRLGESIQDCPVVWGGSAKPQGSLSPESSLAPPRMGFLYPKHTQSLAANSPWEVWPLQTWQWILIEHGSWSPWPNLSFLKPCVLLKVDLYLYFHWTQKYPILFQG